MLKPARYRKLVAKANNDYNSVNKAYPWVLDMEGSSYALFKTLKLLHVEALRYKLLGKTIMVRRWDGKYWRSYKL